MATMTVKGAIERVRITPPYSPLLVLRKEGRNEVEVVFANTLVSKAMLLAGDPRIVGVFSSCNVDDLISAVGG